MRRQGRPVHELPSLARYLNKVFDFCATAATLTDSRVAPEIPPSDDDVLRYSLSGFHLEGLERMLVQVNRTLKRSKALDTGRVQGRIVAALGRH